MRLAELAAAEAGMTYERTTTHGTDPAETERHNAWVEDQRYRWCQRCFENTGIKRVLGTSSFGMDVEVPTCPVCRGTRVGQPESHPQTAPDAWADRVAP